MAYEALIVIGFGVALAVASVALFWAHVQRINAPNKADPGGTLVEIDLAAARARDEASRHRKLSARGSRDARRCDGPASVYSFMALAEGVGGSGSSPCVAGGKTGVVDARVVDRVANFDAIPRQLQEEASLRPSTMVLPSAVWAEAILKHADMKRKKLRNMVKHGEVAAGWEGTWERLPLARRRRLLEDVRDELVHAVSSYVGRDEALFEAVCPDLNVSALEEEHRGVTGLSRLVRRCLDGKLPEPRSHAFAAVQDALVKAASADSVPKDKRGAVRAFLPTFRKLCSHSLCIGALEAIVSGRADGSAGPTLSSFCTALIKTGGSGILVWAFFRGLQQMSASDLAEGDLAGLPPVVGGEGELL